MLRQWDRHSDEVTLWSDEAPALASLAVHVRSSWDNVTGTDGVPYRPPTDDQAAVDLYYGPKEDRRDADYSLYPADIGRYRGVGASRHRRRAAGPVRGEPVPLHVEVEDATVSSAGIAPNRATAGGWWKRLRQLVGRVQWPRGD